jgi:hypothetical protein
MVFVFAVGIASPRQSFFNSGPQSKQTRDDGLCFLIIIRARRSHFFCFRFTSWRSLRCNRFDKRRRRGFGPNSTMNKGKSTGDPPEIHRVPVCFLRMATRSLGGSIEYTFIVTGVNGL